MTDNFLVESGDSSDGSRRVQGRNKVGLLSFKTVHLFLFVMSYLSLKKQLLHFQNLGKFA
jgi:hypothetical protein